MGVIIGSFILGSLFFGAVGGAVILSKNKELLKKIILGFIWTMGMLMAVSHIINYFIYSGINIIQYMSKYDGYISFLIILQDPILQSFLIIAFTGIIHSIAFVGLNRFIR